MDDLISRQAAIETVRKAKSIGQAHRMLVQLPSAQLRWIPCSKKLPELNRSVLVQLSDDFVDPIQIMTLNISKCEGDFFYFWKTQEMGINFEMGDVVAWMPLPTPAKIEG